MNSLAAALFSALGLGIVTAVHPCLIALNVSALAAITGFSKTTTPPYYQSLFYLAGRASGYTLIALIITSSLFAVPSIALFLQDSIFRFIGPVLILAGMVVSGLLSFGSIPGKVAGLSLRFAGAPYLRIALIGLIHTLAFCPASAGLYFGVLLPLAVGLKSEVLLSAVYGIGTGLPLMVVLALSSRGLDFLKLRKSRIIDFWIPKISGVFLILAGIYLTLDRMLNIWT
jgi:hypothetical protein